MAPLGFLQEFLQRVTVMRKVYSATTWNAYLEAVLKQYPPEPHTGEDENVKASPSKGDAAAEEVPSGIPEHRRLVMQRKKRVLARNEEEWRQHHKDWAECSAADRKRELTQKVKMEILENPSAAYDFDTALNLVQVSTTMPCEVVCLSHKHCCRPMGTARE